MGLRRASRTQERPPGAGRPNVVTLDVAPPKVTLEERYELTQEVSETRAPAVVHSSSGRVSATVVYEGVPFLHWHRAQEPAAQAVVGHVAFSDHHDTDLADSCRRSTLTLRAPVLPCGLPRRPETAADGGREFAWWLDYAITPATPPVLVGAELAVKIVDQDSVDREDESHGSTEHVRALMDHPRFRPALVMRLQLALRLRLPEERRRPTAPIMRTTSVDMPWLTSLDQSALSLASDDGRPAPIQHDPASGSVRWFDVRLQGEDAPRGAGGASRTWSFLSPEMTVRFRQPGELFDSDRLTIRAEVELPGLLLSGTLAKSFDPSGRRTSRLTQRSILDLTCDVILADAFGSRDLWAFQEFVFDEIVPDDRRTDDVVSAVENLGFEVDQREDLDESGYALLSYLEARRGSQTTRRELEIVVAGKASATHRRTRHDSDRQYSSRIDSGELRVYVHGNCFGSATDLVADINQLHVALKERFRPLRSVR